MQDIYAPVAAWRMARPWAKRFLVLRGCRSRSVQFHCRNSLILFTTYSKILAIRNGKCLVLVCAEYHRCCVYSTDTYCRKYFLGLPSFVSSLLEKITDLFWAYLSGFKPCNPLVLAGRYIARHILVVCFQNYFWKPSQRKQILPARARWSASPRSRWASAAVTCQNISFMPSRVVELFLNIQLHTWVNAEAGW